MKVAKKKTLIYIARLIVRKRGIPPEIVQVPYRLAIKLPQKNTKYGFNGTLAKLEI